MADPFWVVVYPAERTAERLSPTIGVESPRSNELMPKHPARKGSPTAELDQLKGGDKIVAVADQPVSDYATLIRQLARHPGDTLRVTVERQRRRRQTGGAAKRPRSRLKPIDDRRAGKSLLTLGLSMKMGPITAVQEHSPAAEAGLEVGDVITEIDGEPAGDPLSLPNRLAAKAGQTVVLSITRERSDGTVRTVSKVDHAARARAGGTSRTCCCRCPFPQGAPALGIAYRIENVIDGIAPGSPAETATLKAKPEGEPAQTGRRDDDRQSRIHAAPGGTKRAATDDGRRTSTSSVRWSSRTQQAELAGLSSAAARTAAGNSVQADHDRWLDGGAGTGGRGRLVQSRSRLQSGRWKRSRFVPSRSARRS